MSLVGNLGAGQRVEERIVGFAHGTRVFQATMLGSSLDADAIDTFFRALRVAS